LGEKDWAPFSKRMSIVTTSLVGVSVGAGVGAGTGDGDVGLLE
jgi:hypothetical protein